MKYDVNNHTIYHVNFMINFVFNALLCISEVNNFNPCNHDVDNK